MRSCVRVLLLALVCLMLSATNSFGQPTSGSISETQGNNPRSLESLPDAPTPQASASGEKNRFKRFQELVLGRRSLHVTNDLNSAPMNARGKLGLFARESVAPGQFLAVGFIAGVSQARDQFSEYGQGASGYGKRYGAALGDSVSGKFFGTFLFPVIFHEDPRYYRKGNGGVGPRLGWALKKTFIVRKDNGEWSLGYSRILGNVAAGTLSNAYYPQSDRGVGLTAQRAAVLTAFSFAGSVLQEFWPDVAAKLLGKKRPAPTVDPTSPQVSPEKAGRR